MFSMKIIRIKRKTKALEDFEKREWGRVHPEHYGHKINWDFWEKVKFRLVAKEGGKIIGKLTGHYMAGAMFIGELLVGHEYQGQGVGQALMAEAEKLAKRKKFHKIYLETGVGWRAVEFYEKLGYKKEARLEKLWEKKDFWIMSKFL